VSETAVGLVGRSFTILLWLVVNLAIGYCAIRPLGLAMTMVSYLRTGDFSSHHPYTEVWGRVSPFSFDSDEVEVVAMILFVAAVVLTSLSVLSNNTLRRRWLHWWHPAVLWPLAIIVQVMPSVWFWV
jgi:hypothetical protein